MSLKQDHSSTYTGLHEACGHPLGPQSLKSHLKIICSFLSAYRHYLSSYLEFFYWNFATFLKREQYSQKQNKTKQTKKALPHLHAQGISVSKGQHFYCTL